MPVSFTGNKLSSCFSIRDKTKFEHRHNVIYFRTCPEMTCNDNNIGEAKQQIFKRVKDDNGRDFNSHLLKDALEKNHQHVSERDFKIIGNGFWGNKKKRKVAEALLIPEIKPTLIKWNSTDKVHCLIFEVLLLLMLISDFFNRMTLTALF